MTTSRRHDAWNAGDAYEQYMGRWSRRVAPGFLDWLAPAEGLRWADVGCGTGALCAAILDHCAPAEVIGIEPSPGFLALAREQVADRRVRFERAEAEALPLPDGSRDMVVSALMVNFVPDRDLALAEMRRVTGPGGMVAFYVWDFPGGGIELMRTFWSAAIALDPNAADLAEDKRFLFCRPQPLAAMAAAVGLRDIAVEAIEIATVFRDFDDYWRPFTLGAGSAPGYCKSLSETAREALRRRLKESLTCAADGTIALKARAWAVRGRANPA